MEIKIFKNNNYFFRFITIFIVTFDFRKNSLTEISINYGKINQ